MDTIVLTTISNQVIVGLLMTKTSAQFLSAALAVEEAQVLPALKTPLASAGKHSQIQMLR